MFDFCWPPLRLGFFASTIWVICFLARFNDVDESRDDLFAVFLSEILQGASVVLKNLCCVSNFQPDHSRICDVVPSVGIVVRVF